MAIGIVGTVILVVGIILMVGSFAKYNFDKEAVERKDRDKIKFPTGIFTSGLFVGIFAIIIFTSTQSIPAGARGVGILWGGEVEDRQISEGLALKIPFVESIETIDTRVQAHEFKAIDAASKEMQTVKLTGNVNWKFDQQYVPWIYQNIGANKDFVDKILDKSLQDILKEVTPIYPVSEILNKRSEIRAKSVKTLTDILGRYHILIDDIYIADIQFSPEYLAAIEKQQVAERQVATERNILDQIKIQADQANTKAVGDANANATRAEGQKRANIMQAEGEAQAILTVAEAQAKSNDMISKSLTKNIIDYTYAQKLAPNLKVMIIPSGQNFILGSDVIGGN